MGGLYRNFKDCFGFSVGSQKLLTIKLFQTVSKEVKHKKVDLKPGDIQQTGKRPIYKPNKTSIMD